MPSRNLSASSAATDLASPHASFYQTQGSSPRRKTPPSLEPPSAAEVRKMRTSCLGTSSVLVRHACVMLPDQQLGDAAACWPGKELKQCVSDLHAGRAAGAMHRPRALRLTSLEQRDLVRPGGHCAAPHAS